MILFQFSATHVDTFNINAVKIVSSDCKEGDFRSQVLRSGGEESPDSGYEAA